MPIAAMVSDGYSFLVEMLFEAKPPRLPHRRSPDHLHRAPPGAIEAVVQRPDRIADHAVAPGAARAARPLPDMRHVVVMVTTSYPRFPGDSVGTFMEPIARASPARGHEVHIVAPVASADHARQRRGRRLLPLFQVRAGAGAERVRLCGGPARRRQRARQRRGLRRRWRWRRDGSRRCAWRRNARATVMHGHWVVPGGVDCGGRAAGPARWSSACMAPTCSSPSDSGARRGRGAARLRPRRGRHRLQRRSRPPRRAAGGAPDRIDVVPYGVDVARFSPPLGGARSAARSSALPADAPLVFAAGRLVHEEGLRIPDRRAGPRRRAAARARRLPAPAISTAELRGRAARRRGRSARRVPWRPAAGRRRGVVRGGRRHRGPLGP